MIKIILMFVTWFVTTSTATANYFEVQGHRGARAERPENTLSAFQYALELGVDTLEMDLNVTKDNILVVTHDPTINSRICQIDNGFDEYRGKAIRELTLEQIKQYDCGAKINPSFPNQIPQPHERIPTFEEVIIWLKNNSDPWAKKVMLNIEIKSDEKKPNYSPEPKVFSKLVIDMIKKYKLTDRVTIQSFDIRTLIAAKEIDLKIKTSILLSTRPKEKLPDLAKRLKADVISPYYGFIKESDIIALHAMGVKVIPWTPNSTSSWKKLSQMNVDGIISDNPRKLLEYRDALFELDNLDSE